MRPTAQRSFVIGCLACGLALLTRAEPLLRGKGASAPHARAVPAGTAAGLPGFSPAFVLTSLLVLLLAALAWRHWRRFDTLAGLQRQLAQERSLRAGAEQALLDTHARLCQLVALQDGVKENERRRIGRDIHDDLGQNLLALKIDISMLQLGSAGQAPLQQRLALVANNIDLTIQSLRCIINDLRPTALEAGLKAAVERQLHEFTRISGIDCELAADADVYEAGARGELDTMVFRVLQESLSNIARHANASAVKIALRRDAGGLTLTVRDNGVGMPAGQAVRGCGLLGIKDRVAAAGGRFVIDSLPGQGTALSLSIPLHETQASD